MTEKRAVNDVFQEAYQDFFAKEKAKKEGALPDGTAPEQDQAHPGDLPLG